MALALKLQATTAQRMLMLVLGGVASVGLLLLTHLLTEGLWELGCAVVPPAICAYFLEFLVLVGCINFALILLYVALHSQTCA